MTELRHVLERTRARPGETHAQARARREPEPLCRAVPTGYDLYQKDVRVAIQEGADVCLECLTILELLRDERQRILGTARERRAGVK